MHFSGKTVEEKTTETLIIHGRKTESKKAHSMSKERQVLSTTKTAAYQS